MQVLPVDNARAWDEVLLSLPNPHVLQSWAWGAFKARHGWQAARFLFQEGGQTVAAASVLQRRLPRLPASILYVPKGPALDWIDADLAARVLAELESLARQRRALFVKVDPDVYYAEDGALVSTRPACASDVAGLLELRGWQFSDDQIQFRNTVLLDLAGPEDDLLAVMKQKGRYNVRLAARRGVTVRRSGAGGDPGELAGDLATFCGLYAETARRDGFLIRPASYYHDAWGAFLETGMAHLLLAEFEGEPLAGLVLFTFGPTAWYMYGASSARHRRHMPNYLLQWEAIRQARAAGCSLYDLWGAPDTVDESDPMWGVYRFKLRLGGQLARGLGAWDFPASRAGYRFYTRIMPRVLSWMRSRDPQAG